jgi:hypothetical protein
MSDDLKTPYDDDPEKREIFLQGAAAAATEPKPLTIDDVRNMSVAEVIARKDEVHEALKRGEGRGDEDGEET